MKYFLILICTLTLVSTGQAQEAIVVTYQKGETRVQTNEKGELHVNITPEDTIRLKKAGQVTYRDFGAIGDGKTDDIEALAATHAYANAHHLPVKADDGATYYIGGKRRTVVIQTPTDFGMASFLIDDRETEDYTAPVFLVATALPAFQPKGISTLRKNQKKVDVDGPCLVTVTNANVRHYIRFGLNQNNGSSQTDIFLVNKNGEVDPQTPIIWDFDQITDITAQPLDKDTLLIRGGRFTTVANQAESKYTYYSRNIAIRRSNVVVEGLQHFITGEGEQGAPYGGFLHIGECANVTVRNCVLTGHKTYSTIGAAGKPVSMGTYDLLVNRALNVSFIRCTQTNAITDTRYWGIFGSNFSKNLVFDGCTLSRFDAHQGVANATILNSTLGHMGINAIGTGLFRIENSTVLSGSFINLRSDYGSTWQGELLIRHCKFIPANGRPVTASLINGHYTGLHDFGYTCYMPEKITIENLEIDDSNHPENYRGPAIFSDFNPEMKDESYREKFPYVKTREVILHRVHTASGKPLRISNNTFMFREVTVTEK